MHLNSTHQHTWAERPSHLYLNPSHQHPRTKGCLSAIPDTYFPTSLGWTGPLSYSWISFTNTTGLRNTSQLYLNHTQQLSRTGQCFLVIPTSYSPTSLGWGGALLYQNHAHQHPWAEGCLSGSGPASSRLLYSSRRYLICFLEFTLDLVFHLTWANKQQMKKEKKKSVKPYYFHEELYFGNFCRNKFHIKIKLYESSRYFSFK